LKLATRRYFASEKVLNMFNYRQKRQRVDAASVERKDAVSGILAGWISRSDHV